MKTSALYQTAICSLLLFLFLLTGCKTYLHLKYGMTQPKEETIRSLTEFLAKNHYPLRDQYLFRDSASYGEAVRNPVFGKRLLNNLIFNRQGDLIQKDTTQCQWAGYDQISLLHPDSTYATTPGLNLSWLLERIMPLKGPVDPSTDHPDYTVIVTWAKFIGTYNYRLFDLAGAPGKNHAARIRLIWLNVDLQESWQLSSKQKPVFK